MLIDKELLKRFYEIYQVKAIEMPKYFGFYEIIDNKAYPAFTSERFIKLLNMLWKEQVDMNFDHDCDLETLIMYRGETYPERVIMDLVENAPIHYEDQMYNNIRYYVKDIFKEG